MMINKKISITKQIKDLVDSENEYGINQLVEKYSSTNHKGIKKKLADAYVTIFGFRFYDLMCFKIKQGTEPDFISGLLQLLEKAEKLQPQLNLLVSKAECYSLLVDYEASIDKKIICLDLAIGYYKTLLKKTKTKQSNNDYLASALWEKMVVTQNYTTAYFSEILELFVLAFKKFSLRAFRNFLYVTYEILDINYENKKEWHATFIKRFNQLAYQVCLKKPLIYLEWSTELNHILDLKKEILQTNDLVTLSNFSEELMLNLQNYKTVNHDELNRLGQAFDRLANTIDDKHFNKKLLYYQNAFSFYMQGHNQSPAAWTFTVYATNMLVNIAELFYAKNDKDAVINTLSQGTNLFSETEKHLGNNYTLASYFGDYCLAFAKLGYDFKNESMLEDAEKQLLIAKKLGNGSYSRPFISLAKVALKKDNKEKCLDILRECKSTFTTVYSTYEFSEVLNDKDFEAVWLDLKAKEFSD